MSSIIALIGGGTTLIGIFRKDQTRKNISKKEIDNNIINIEVTLVVSLIPK